jgi:hypothetical protein
MEASALPGAAVHEGSSADLDTVAEVLGEAVSALDEGRIGYVPDRRPRLRRARAPALLERLERAGFRTDPIDPHWLYKAFRRDVLVDLLFKVRGEIGVLRRLGKQVLHD